MLIANQRDRRNRHRIESSSRRGAMLPLIAVMLPVLMVFVGFAVDLAYMQNTRLEMRAATDSAARAAATNLSFTDSVSQARAEAKRIAGLNSVAGKPLQLEDSDIVFGHSEKNDAGRWVFTSGGTPNNSVRVLSRRTAASPGGAVPMFFGSFIGRSDFQPTETATASFENVDICLVLDRSTSMKVSVGSDEQGLTTDDPRFCQPPNSTSRWNALDAAVRVFVAELRQTSAVEQIALASYSSGVASGTWCGANPNAATLDSPLEPNLALIESGIGQLSSTVWNGNTNIEAGMRVALNELTTAPTVRNNAEKIVIVFTDGHENVGDCVAAANDIAGQNMRIHTVTLGDFANQAKMQEVAAIGAGRHLHADNAAALAAAFRELAAQVSQLTE